MNFFKKRIRRIVSLITLICFSFTSTGFSQGIPPVAYFPQAPFTPPSLKYLSVNESNPNNYFNFLLDKGNYQQPSVSVQQGLNQEAKKLVNYFFLGLTLPDEAFWVNLKPNESNRIISEELAKTDLGKVLLEQDFKLKRDMSQYLNPQNPVGKQFWEKLYSALGRDKVKKAQITTSNRVWIVPAEAVVLETEDGALLVKSSLKVLLESEYAALQNQRSNIKNELNAENNSELQKLTESLMKEIIIPAITKDVNESQNYAPLRQVYHSLILAQWFKRKHKNADSVYGKAVDKGYTNGLTSQFPWEKQAIWQDYLKSYQNGEYKFIDKTVFNLKRMYFSGGILFDWNATSLPVVGTFSSVSSILRVIQAQDVQKNPEAFEKLIQSATSTSSDLPLTLTTTGSGQNLEVTGLAPLDFNVHTNPASLIEKETIKPAIPVQHSEKPSVQISSPIETPSEMKESDIASSPSIFQKATNIFEKINKKILAVSVFAFVSLAAPIESFAATLKGNILSIEHGDTWGHVVAKFFMKSGDKLWGSKGSAMTNWHKLPGHAGDSYQAMDHIKAGTQIDVSSLSQQATQVPQTPPVSPTLPTPVPPATPPAPAPQPTIEHGTVENLTNWAQNHPWAIGLAAGAMLLIGGILIYKHIKNRREGGKVVTPPKPQVTPDTTKQQPVPETPKPETAEPVKPAVVEPSKAQVEPIEREAPPVVSKDEPQPEAAPESQDVVEIPPSKIQPISDQPIEVERKEEKAIVEEELPGEAISEAVPETQTTKVQEEEIAKLKEDIISSFKPGYAESKLNFEYKRVIDDIEKVFLPDDAKRFLKDLAKGRFESALQQREKEATLKEDEIKLIARDELEGTDFNKLNSVKSDLVKQATACPYFNQDEREALISYLESQFKARFDELQKRTERINSAKSLYRDLLEAVDKISTIEDEQSFLSSKEKFTQLNHEHKDIVSELQNEIKAIEEHIVLADARLQADLQKRTEEEKRRIRLEHLQKSKDKYLQLIASLKDVKIIDEINALESSFDEANSFSAVPPDVSSEEEIKELQKQAQEAISQLKARLELEEANRKKDEKIIQIKTSLKELVDGISAISNLESISEAREKQKKIAALASSDPDVSQESEIISLNANLSELLNKKEVQIREGSWNQLIQGVVSKNVNVPRLISKLRRYLLKDSPSGNEDELISELTSDIQAIFGSAIKPVLLPTGKTPIPKNLVFEISATQGYEDEPAVILNAHMDTIDADPNLVNVDLKDKDIRSSERSKPIGLDDSIGLAVIIEALHILKERWDTNNIPHRTIKIIFSAEEEPPTTARNTPPAYGLRYLSENMPAGLFDNIYTVVTVDGHLCEAKEPDLDKTLSGKETQFSAVLKNFDREDERFTNIEKAAKKVKSDALVRTPVLLPGFGGDENIFAEIQDGIQKENLRVINLRANYEGAHYQIGPERVKVKDLVDLADWLVEIMFGIDDGLRIKPDAAIVSEEIAKVEPETEPLLDTKADRIKEIDEAFKDYHFDSDLQEAREKLTTKINTDVLLDDGNKKELIDLVESQFKKNFDLRKDRAQKEEQKILAALEEAIKDSDISKLETLREILIKKVKSCGYFEQKQRNGLIDKINKIFDDRAAEVKLEAVAKYSKKPISQDVYGRDDFPELAKNGTSQQPQLVKDEKSLSLEKKQTKLDTQKPYDVIILDIDRTLSPTKQFFDEDMIKLLLWLLQKEVGIKIAIVTAQCKDEVETYFLSQARKFLGSDVKPDFSNLVIYASTGAKAYEVNKQGEVANVAIYDKWPKEIDISNLSKDIENIFLKNKVTAYITERNKLSKGNTGIEVHEREGSITIGGLDGVKDKKIRSYIVSEVESLFRKKYNGRLALYQYKNHTWHILANELVTAHKGIDKKGEVDKKKIVDKGTAVRHFLLNYLIGKIPKDPKVLVIGDSFSKTGMDRKMKEEIDCINEELISGYRINQQVISVGGRELSPELREGILFSEEMPEVKKRGPDAAKMILSYIKSNFNQQKSSVIRRKLLLTNGPIDVIEGNIAKDYSIYKFNNLKIVNQSVSLNRFDKVIFEKVLNTLANYGYRDSIDKIKLIRIVEGNDRLASYNAPLGQIVIDIDAFKSANLLFMEIEHELNHISLSEKPIDPIAEELTIIVNEVQRFLSFDPGDQEDVLSVLKSDKDMDDIEFYKLLEKARLLPLEGYFDDILVFLEKIYHEDISSFPKDKLKEEIINEIRQQIGRLNAENNNSRIEAIRHLGEIRDISALPRLVQLFMSGKTTFSEDWALRDTLIKYGRALTPYLYPFLENASHNKCATAIWLLGRIGEKSAINLLINKLRDQNEKVLSAVLYSVGEIGDKTAIPYIIPLLSDWRESIRKDAIRALGELKDPVVIPSLMNILGGADYDIESSVTSALEEIVQNNPFKIMNYLQSDKPEIRRVTVSILGDMNYPKLSKHFLELLDDQDERTKLKAIKALIKMKDRTTYQDIIDTIKTFKNIELRLEAIKDISFIGDPAFIPEIVNELSEYDEDLEITKSIACYGIPDMGKAAIPYLMPYLSEGNGVLIRQIAILFLGFTSEKSIIPTLQHIAKNDKDLNVQKQAILALGELKDSSISYYLEGILNYGPEELQNVALLALANIGKEALPILEKYILQKDKPFYNQLLDILLEYKEFHGTIAPFLIEVLRNDKHEYEREKIVNIFVRIGNPVVSLLISSLNDRNNYIRISCLQALAKLKQRSSIQQIKKQLEDKNEEIRIAAIESLWPFQDDSIAVDLKKMLDKETPKAKLAIANALIELGDRTTAISILSALALKDKDRGVEYKGQNALSMLKYLGEESLIPLFLEVLKKQSYNDKDKEAAIQGLGRIGEDTIPYLLELLDMEHRNKDLEYGPIRYSALQALALIGGKSLIPVFEDVFMWGSYVFRDEAARALCNTDIEYLIGQLKSEDLYGRRKALRILAAAKTDNVKASFPIVINILGDRDERMREEAMKILTDSYAVPLLLKALASDDPLVVNCAAKVLLKINESSREHISLGQEGQLQRFDEKGVLLGHIDKSYTSQMMKLLRDHNGDVALIACVILTKIGYANDFSDSLAIKFIRTIEDNRIIDPNVGIFIAKLINNIGVQNLSRDSIQCLYDHIMYYLPYGFDFYYPILVKLWQLKMISDKQFDTIYILRMSHLGFKIEKTDNGFIIIGKPEFIGQNIQKKSKNGKNSEVILGILKAINSNKIEEFGQQHTKRSFLYFSVDDEEYDRQKDGYALAFFQIPDQYAQKEPIWLYLGEKVVLENSTNSFLGKNIDIWEVNGNKYARKYFIINGEKFIPFGIDLNGKKIWYQSVETGFVFACSLNSEMLHNWLNWNKRIYKVSEGDIFYYKGLWTDINNEITYLKIYSPEKFNRYFSKENKFSGFDIDFTLEGRNWLEERFNISYSELRTLFSLYEINKNSDLIAISALRHGLLESSIFREKLVINHMSTIKHLTSQMTDIQSTDSWVSSPVESPRIKKINKNRGIKKLEILEFIKQEKALIGGIILTIFLALTGQAKAEDINYGSINTRGPTPAQIEYSIQNPQYIPPPEIKIPKVKSIKRLEVQKIADQYTAPTMPQIVTINTNAVMPYEGHSNDMDLEKAQFYIKNLKYDPSKLYYPDNKPKQPTDNARFGRANVKVFGSALNGLVGMGETGAYYLIDAMIRGSDGGYERPDWDMALIALARIAENTNNPDLWVKGWVLCGGEHSFYEDIRDAFRKQIDASGIASIKPLLDLFGDNFNMENAGFRNSGEQNKKNISNLLLEMSYTSEYRDEIAKQIAKKIINWKYYYESNRNSYNYDDKRTADEKKADEIEQQEKDAVLDLARNANLKDAIGNLYKQHLFFEWHWHARATSIRAIYENSPFWEKYKNYAISIFEDVYLYALAILTIGTGIYLGFLFNRYRKINKVYKQLLDYSGSVSIGDRIKLWKTAKISAVKNQFDIDSMFTALNDGLPSISKDFQLKRMKLITQFVIDLQALGLNAANGLQYGVGFLIKHTKNDVELENGIKKLTSIYAPLNQSPINKAAFNTYNSISKLLSENATDLKTFDAICDFLIKCFKANANPNVFMSSKIVGDMAKNHPQRLDVLLQLITAQDGRDTDGSAVTFITKHTRNDKEFTDTVAKLINVYATMKQTKSTLSGVSKLISDNAIDLNTFSILCDFFINCLKANVNPNPYMSSKNKVAADMAKNNPQRLDILLQLIISQQGVDIDNGSVAFLAKHAKDDKEFTDGMTKMSGIYDPLKQSSVKNTFSTFNSISKLITDNAIDMNTFFVVCDFIIRCLNANVNPSQYMHGNAKVLGGQSVVTNMAKNSSQRLDILLQLLIAQNQIDTNNDCVVFLMQHAKDDKEFTNAITKLKSIYAPLKESTIAKDFNTSNSISKIIADNAIDVNTFYVLCDFFIKCFKANISPAPYVYEKLIPKIIKNKDPARSLDIMVQLHSAFGAIPTQYLIDTAEQSQSITATIKIWKNTLSNFKNGTVKFDINNPLHVDLEYFSYIKLAANNNLDASYKSYIDVINKFRSDSANPSNLSKQEQGEVRISTYEAFKLLDYISVIKSKTKRPIWVVANLTYGKFAVSPIVGELGRMGIEIHYAKIGSSECHNHPNYVKPSLFTDEEYKRIMNENPVLVVVDGTQYTSPRLAEQKSPRYPDAYIGYRNLVVAINDTINQQDLDKAKLSKDLLQTLHNDSAYKELLEKLKKFGGNSTEQYSIEFWNPAEATLVVREARKEIEKMKPFDLANFNSEPVLIFIDDAMVDGDVPPNIKEWADMDGTEHMPAFYDDKDVIKSTKFAVNGVGLYMSHGLEYEVNKASREYVEKFWTPVVVSKPEKPKEVKQLEIPYEAIIFDLDGTLSETQKPIDQSISDKLALLLNKGIHIIITTSQDISEVKTNVLDQLKDKSHLYNLELYTARGAQQFSFSTNNIIQNDWDMSNDFNPGELDAIKSAIKETLGNEKYEIFYRGGGTLITIHLDDKNKRDSLAEKLEHVIQDIPDTLDYIVFEKPGKRTINIIFSERADAVIPQNDKRTAIIDALEKHDPKKVLFIGDRFKDEGSRDNDRSAITSLYKGNAIDLGVRVVSVGDKDTNKIPSGVEAYSDKGWRGTNRFLGDLLGQPVASSPITAIPIIAAAVPTTIALIRLFRGFKLYSKISQSISFLNPFDRFIIFMKTLSYVPWFKTLKDANEYALLKTILPIMAQNRNDKRLTEIANMIDRFSNTKVDVKDFIKYGLTSVSLKTSNKDKFVQSLQYIEQFAKALISKHFNPQLFLNTILSSLNTSTKTIEEFDEAVLLGISLVNNGRDPQQALCELLPQIKTNNFTEYKTALYAINKLTVENIEPTVYLVQTLSTQSNVDKTISEWKKLLKDIKADNIAFDPKDQLHLNLEYTTFKEFTDRTLKAAHRYSYREYLSIIANAKNQTGANLNQTERSEIKYAAYEAFATMQFILRVQLQAKMQGRNVWVVPNLSYGRFAVSPIVNDLMRAGIEVHYARIGSTESHKNPSFLKPDLFSPALYARIINEKPVIIVVDGTQHTLPREKENKSGRYPDAYVGYRNMVVAINDIISHDREDSYKKGVRTSGHFIQDLRKSKDYTTLKRRFRRYYNPDGDQELYSMEFWNPSGSDLVIREARKEKALIKPVSSLDINGPTLIFINSVMKDEDVPVFIKTEVTEGNRRIKHIPAYFDDTSHIQNIIFDVDAKGIHLSDAIDKQLRKEYTNIRKSYEQINLTLDTKIWQTNLAYKIGIFDLDGTLASTLVPISNVVLNKLLYLMQSGMHVALITVQNLEEINKNLVSLVLKDQRPLLQNLTLYPSTGSQARGFDKNGNIIPASLYDASQSLTPEQNATWRNTIKSILEDYGLNKELTNLKGKLVALPAEIVDGQAQIIIRLNERRDLRDNVIKKLTDKFTEQNLPLSITKLGRTSIRININGFDKSYAVNFHIKEVNKQMNHHVDPKQILIVGNSFDENGDDRQMMIDGARVVSVGSKPDIKLRKGIEFYPIRGWQGTSYLLSEIINNASKKTNNETPMEVINKAAERINKKYLGTKVAIIGAVAPTKEYTSEIGIKLGNVLKNNKNIAYVFTGGVGGAGVDVYKGFGADRFFVLLPEGLKPDIEYKGIKPDSIEGIGRNMYDRRIGISKVADIVIVLNGRGGTMHEAITALQNGKKVIALPYGGAGLLLYNAKKDNSVGKLASEGLKPEYLANIISADDFSGLTTYLSSVVSSPLKTDTMNNPGGIDLSKIELTLKDEKYISSLNPADLKILRAARALKQGWNSLAVLYAHEVRLLLKDRIISENDITQKALLQSLLIQLEQKESLDLQTIQFRHILNGQMILASKRQNPEKKLVLAMQTSEAREAVSAGKQ